jgi:hypothetical protein
VEHSQSQDRVELLGGQSADCLLYREWFDTDGIKDTGPIVLTMGPQAEKGEFDRS